MTAETNSYPQNPYTLPVHLFCLIWRSKKEGSKQ